MQPHYQAELKIAKLAAKQAGQYLKTEFNKFSRKNIQYKTKRDAVTYCDKKAEKIIITKLRKHFPNHSILSEEAGLLNKKSDYFWTIDPLDGTHNFINHIPVFAVSIALFYQNEPVVGVIYIPFLNEIYYAVKNGGAYKNNKHIKINQIYDLPKMFLCYSNGKSKMSLEQAFKINKKFKSKVYRVRNFASTAVEMALTASGNFDAYISALHSIWDVGAGVVLLQEAGAKVTNWKNQSITKKSTSILATNAKMHSVYLRELKKIKLA